MTAVQGKSRLEKLSRARVWELAIASHRSAEAPEFVTLTGVNGENRADAVKNGGALTLTLTLL